MRYRMHRKLANPLGAVGERYVIEDEGGQVRYTTAMKPSVLRLAIGMRDAEGCDALTVRMVSMTRPPTHFEIERGEQKVDVEQHFQNGHQHFTATAPNGESIEAAGDWHARTFTFLRGGQEIGPMTGDWYSMTERYDIEVAPGEDDVLLLGYALTIHIANEPAR